MATYIQRAQAYCDSLLNKVATPAQIDRVGTAYARNSNRFSEYSAGTNTVRAQILIEEARKLAINIVKATEAQTAAQAAAVNSVVNTDADFTEGP